MSGVKEFLGKRGPGSLVFLVFAFIGGVVAVFGGLTSGAYGINFHSGLVAFADYVFLGLFFGGIVWTENTLSLWRRSLTKRLIPERDPAVEALRERYARGEINPEQFESTLHRLRES